MLSRLGRQNIGRAVAAIVITAFAVIYHLVAPSPTPSAATARWASQYEHREAKALNGLQSTMTNFNEQTSQAQLLKTCRLGVHDVTMFQSEPLPPNQQLRTIYAKFLTANLVFFTECVDGIMKADTNEMNKMVAQSSVVAHLSDQFNSASSKLGL